MESSLGSYVLHPMPGEESSPLGPHDTRLGVRRGGSYPGVHGFEPRRDSKIRS